VKRSKEGGDTSRAIGKYFFFCSKKRDDETQCRFARPVEMELNKKNKNADSGAKKGKAQSGPKDKRGDSKKPEKEKPKQKVICKFFAKIGSCKKGKKCEFSHDVQGKKAVDKAPETKKTIEVSKDEKNVEESSTDDSSTDDSSDSSSSDSGDDNKGGEAKNKDDSTSDSDDSSSSDDESD